MASIRHCISASCIVCTSRNTMVSIRPTVHVQKTFVFASCALCTSCNQMASIRQILRIRLDIVRTVHVAKTRWCPYDTSFCRETRWRPNDTLCTFIRHYASVSCINSNAVRIVRVAKPDGIHTTLAFVAKLDGVPTTHNAHLYDTTSRCRA